MYRLILIYYVFLWKPLLIYAENRNAEVTAVEYIKKNGYPIEIYSNIQTEDNYLLDIYRIPHGRFSRERRAREPVLLMHGLFRTSRDFVAGTPDRALAYILAEKSYDVWLPNARGSVYSRKHLTLNPELDAQFWNFSWHEIGVYDLPAIFELIRNVTKRERFSYVGHSEGTTVFYVLTSMKPEYNRNVTVMISLAPIAYMTHISCPTCKAMAAFEPILTPLIRFLLIYEYPPRPVVPLLQFLCSQKGFFQVLCTSFVFTFAGYDPVQFNIAELPKVFDFSLGGSLNELAHYGQNINSGLFRLYDFRRKINLERYNSTQPPSYNLSKITAPVALIYSEGDFLAHPLDVDRLCAEIKNCVYKYDVPIKQFNHADYFWSENVTTLVFKQVLYILDKYVHI